MSEPTCETCRFWKRDTSGAVHGTCHRQPPVLDMIVILSELLNNRDKIRADYEFDENPAPYDADEITRLGTFPETFQDEWCGEHQHRTTSDQPIPGFPHPTTNEA